MTQASPTAAEPRYRGPIQRLQARWQGLSDHSQVGVGGVSVLWALFWPVPTEVEGKGVLVFPNNAGILNARSGGQVQDVSDKTGERVKRGQVLMQLQRHNETLDERDALRLLTEKRALNLPGQVFRRSSPLRRTAVDLCLQTAQLGLAGPA